MTTTVMMDAEAFMRTAGDAFRAIVEWARQLADFNTLNEQQRVDQLRTNAVDLMTLYGIASDWMTDGGDVLLNQVAVGE